MRRSSCKTTFESGFTRTYLIYEIHIRNFSPSNFVFQENPLVHDVAAGVIISNQSLVLQNVRRDSSGIYTCVAHNIEGDGVSNPMTLNVRCEYIVQGSAKEWSLGCVKCAIQITPPFLPGRRPVLQARPDAGVRRGARGDGAHLVRGGGQPGRVDLLRVALQRDGRQRGGDGRHAARQVQVHQLQGKELASH